jgi:hypothetical protein
MDSSTATFPQDPFAGFLPPNRPESSYAVTNCSSCGDVGVVEWIQPGRGYIAYELRPRAGLGTGSVVTNAARIVFDWNDPIDTPLVFNTIDAGTPSSAVLRLPGESGRTILVQWAGEDDPGGSGVASYDVYVSSDGARPVIWLKATSSTSAYFVGELGRTYGFFSIARDLVGHEEAEPNGPQAWTTVSTNSPVLAGISSNTVVYPNERLTITNRVSGGGGAGLLFSLGDSAPTGATVNSTNGVFAWMPNCGQASRTNQITVWVAGGENTNLFDAMTFAVAVGECVVPELGRFVLTPGESGRIPVNLVSSVPLKTLGMTVETLAGRLTNLWVEPTLAQVCSAVLKPTVTNGVSGKDVLDLDLATCPGQSLMGTQQVAWLHFTAVSNLPSAFVDVRLDNTVGYQQNGAPVRNFAPVAGRLAVVGEEPLLEAAVESGGEPSLYVYSQPGSRIIVESTTTLALPVWQPSAPLLMTNLFAATKPGCVQPCTVFCRARRE